MEAPENKSGQTERRFPCWITSFIEKTDHVKSPKIFRRWAAISTIAGALRRHAFVLSQNEPIFPNMYVLLIGPPGTGKGRALGPAKRMLRKTRTHVAPNMTTKEDLIFRLGKSVHDEKVPGWMEIGEPVNGFPYINSTVTVMSEELSNFIQEGDAHFMNALLDLYDCLEVFQKFTKTSGVDDIQNVALNLIAGTTPDAVIRVLPDAAFRQGFAARLVIVYSAESVKQKLLLRDEAAADEAPADNETDLLHDLQAIQQIQGEFFFTKEAAAQLEDWYDKGMAPAPNHPRLTSYNERRLIHLLKLAVVYSASMGNSRVIDVNVLAQAAAALLEAESTMPKALHAMGEYTQGFHIQEAALFVLRYHITAKVAMPESQLRAFLLSRVPVHQVRSVIDEMILADWLQVMGTTVGARAFAPGQKAEELRPKIQPGTVQMPIRQVEP